MGERASVLPYLLQYFLKWNVSWCLLPHLQRTKRFAIKHFFSSLFHLFDAIAAALLCCLAKSYWMASIEVCGGAKGKLMPAPVFLMPTTICDWFLYKCIPSNGIFRSEKWYKEKRCAKTEEGDRTEEIERIFFYINTHLPHHIKSMVICSR